MAATALVVADMVGVGVFVSLGYQLFDFHTATPILLLWVLGGLLALCGAISYASLARALPRSGGEYYFLGQIYHPALGFMAGLLSAVIGFAAPTAIISLALGGYLHKSLPWVEPKAVAVIVILLGAASHSMSTKISGRVQVATTVLKLALILTFIVAAAFLPGKGDIPWSPQPDDWKSICQPAFATSLMFVFYAYLGWNAAVYGLEEWNHPSRTVKRALVGGTLLVILLYVGLNAAFLHAAPMHDLRGNDEIADTAASALFNPAVARWTSGLLALSLFSSASAMLWAGPRVLGAMGKDVKGLNWLASPGEVPRVGLALQTALALLFVFIGKVDTLVNYTSSGLTLCSALAVGGLFILWKRGQGRDIPAIIPLIFVATAAFVIILSLSDPRYRMSALYGLLTAAGCAVLGILVNRKSS